MDFDAIAFETLSSFTPLLNFSEDSLSGWTLAAEGCKDNVEGVMYQEDNSEGNIIGMRSNMKSPENPGVIESKVWPMLMDVDYISSRSNDIDITIVKKIDEDSHIELQTKGLPWPLADREFLSLRRRIRKGPNEIVLLGSPVELEDFPCHEDRVRGTSEHLSKFELTDDNKMNITSVRKLDLGGSIPPSIVKMGASIAFSMSLRFFDVIRGYGSSNKNGE
eukprot:TRINITY_DN111_c0_g1_i1.p1 TRINITY_DN111_c0_g1~~TRINITY_DN111_c0_g1_i1.p1  ORF type:complete len:220 (-),score=47.55 TRINITY_DN111_c0_g1_i1:478-1137(-)